MQNSINPNEIFIFLGPTLSVEVAQTILPARYLPPIKCGDILRYLRLKPSVIGIIDGLFERTAAVWHKEIIWAMEQGVRVFGASSMGALRAAELYPLGMKGIGNIFEAYRDNIYTDDDEVAVLHSDRRSNFAALSEPIVNIRATIADAIQQQAITSQVGDLVIAAAKKRFYGDRLLMEAIDIALAEGAPHDEIARLKQFVGNGGYIDRKQFDAIELLEHLRCLEMDRVKAEGDTSVKTNCSVFLCDLHKIIACSPLEREYSWLPMVEKVALKARFLGKNYLLIRRLAELLLMVDAIAESQNIVPTEIDRQKVFTDDDFGLGANLQESLYCQENDLDFEEFQGLVFRLSRINALLRIEESTHPNSDFSKFLLAILRIQGDYAQLAAQDNGVGSKYDSQVLEKAKNLEKEHYSLYRLIAKLWQIIDRTAVESGFYPSPQTMRETARRLFQNSHIDAKQWLAANKLNLESFAELMIIWTRMSILCQRQDLHSLGIDLPLSNVIFLHDALRLSGFYRLLKDRVQYSSIIEQPFSLRQAPALELLVKQWCDDNQEPVPSNIDKYARDLDFTEGQEELYWHLAQSYLNQQQYWFAAS